MAVNSWQPKTKKKNLNEQWHRRLLGLLSAVGPLIRYAKCKWYVTSMCVTTGLSQHCYNPIASI